MSTMPDNETPPVTDEPKEPVVMDISAPEESVGDVTDEPNAGAGDHRDAESDQVCGDRPVAARLEALLMAGDRAMTEARLAELLGLTGKGTTTQIRAAIDELNRTYEDTGRAFRIERLAGGWQVLTTPEYGPLLHRLYQDRQQTRLSQAALETLAIIAYRQPIIRAEIEAIRGVACGEVLRGLMERRLIKIVGRAEELGRPMLYGTTREFLKVFGLSGLDDLPEVEGLQQMAKSNRRAARGDAADTDVDETVPAADADSDRDPAGAGDADDS
jgi:segregation and condensation protein B